MSLNTLVDYISNLQITSELIKKISKNNVLNIVGSSRYAKSIILDSIAKKEKKNILLICPNVEIAYKWIGYFESINDKAVLYYCLLYTSPSPRDGLLSRMPSSA